MDSTPAEERALGTPLQLDNSILSSGREPVSQSHMQSFHLRNPRTVVPGWLLKDWCVQIPGSERGGPALGLTSYDFFDFIQK